MPQNTQQVSLAKQAEQAVKAQRAPTAKQANRAIQASRAIHIDELKYLRKQNKQVDTFLSNYNDPTELNSYIDALTNREAVSKKFGDTWGTISTASGTAAVLSFIGAAITALIPGGQPVAAALATAGTALSVPAIPAAVDVTIEKGIKPILAGKPEEAGLNMLMNLGETMDYASNPIKGLFLEGPQGFLKGTGLAKGGRINYDYDTGFFLTDMLLETLSDPMNYLTLGTSTAFKISTQATAETVTTPIVDATVKTVNGTFAKTIGEITTEGQSQIQKKVTKATAQVTKEWAEATADNFTKEATKLAEQTGKGTFKFLSQAEQNQLRTAAQKKLLRDGRNKIQRSLIQAIKEQLPSASANDIDIILKQTNRSATNGKFIKSTTKQIRDITFDKLSSDVIQSLALSQHYTDAFEKFMTKSALFTSGYGLGIEAAKSGWKGIRAWQNNYTLSKLSNAKYFDKTIGLDLKHYKEAKNIWQASHDITTEVAGITSQRNIDTFYRFMQEQLNRDKSLIEQIVKDNPTAIKRASALDSAFQQLYGCDFKTYIGYIKGINDTESGLYSSFVQAATEQLNALGSRAITDQAPNTIKNATQLLHTNNVEAVTKKQQQIIDTFSQKSPIKITKNQIEVNEKWYTIKLNDAVENDLLLNDSIISSVISQISQGTEIGTFINKIINDPTSIAGDVTAEITAAAHTLKDASLTFNNLLGLYNSVAELNIPSIVNINSDTLKMYILDEIMGLDGRTVTELLSDFDTITLPDLIQNINTLCANKGVKIEDYPGLRQQISDCYKNFLQAQSDAGLDTIKTAVVQDFTNSATLIANNFANILWLFLRNF